MNRRQLDENPNGSGRQHLDRSTAIAPNPEPVSVWDKVEFLQRRAWPGRAPVVIETHLSWVFLVDDRAYKLKKPVRVTFLDHRTLEARRRDCAAEVRLNNDLAPGVYLGSLALTTDADGELRLGGDGPVEDWLVVMRRLPREMLLDQRLAAGGVGPDELAGLVERLGGFYGSTPIEACEPSAYRQQLLAGIELDRAELRRRCYGLPSASIRQLLAAQRSAVTDLAELDDRASRIVEGHGDLRPEHVLLGSPPLVIDRLTFDRSLRLVDPLFDLALFAVECEHLGARAAGDDVLSGVIHHTSDPASTAVTELYRSLRATTRTRLSIAHLRDGDDHRHQWLQRAEAYLAIAMSHAEGRG